jgi:DNA gyrase subunit A
VDDHDEVMLISTGGVLIRTEVGQIRAQGRSTQGVTLISLDAGQKLAGIERIVERDAESGGDGNGNGGAREEGNGSDDGGNGNGDAEPPLILPGPADPSGLH